MVTDNQKLAFRIRGGGGSCLCDRAQTHQYITPQGAASWIGRRLHIHTATRGEVAREGILSSLYL